MNSKEKRATAIEAAIRKVLNEEWDPLGVYIAGPGDEYDSLIGPIYRLLYEHASQDRLEELLSQFELRTGGAVSTPEEIRVVAQKLRALNVTL